MSVSQRRLVQLGRRRMRSLADGCAVATSPVRMLPGFLIVGAQRCGTTSMFKTLAQHPLVARPLLRKGIHYFDTHYDQNLAWYRGRFPIRALAAMRTLTSGTSGEPITGESSPYYMFHPRAPQHIAETLPDVKVIVLVRDPVERAYSAHSHERGRGFESEDFESALALESSRIDGERERMLADAGYDSFSWQHHAYLRRGRYIDQLIQLENALGRNRVLVVDSHDFFTRPAETFPAVLTFLQLPNTSDILRRIQFDQHNARARSPLPSRLRQQLLEHFDEPDQQLADWWGRVPSWRR